MDSARSKWGAEKTLRDFTAIQVVAKHSVIAHVHDERWDDFGGERQNAITQAAENLDAHQTEFNDFTEHKSPRGPMAQTEP